MDGLFDIHEINIILFSLVPNELRGVNKYYNSMSNGLKLNPIIRHSLNPTIGKFSEYLCNRIIIVDLRYIVPHKYGSRLIRASLDIKRLNPRILYTGELLHNIKHMTNIVELDASNNRYINDSTSLNYLTNIKKLNILNCKGVTDNSILNMAQLEELIMGSDSIYLEDWKEWQDNINVDLIKQMPNIKLIVIHRGDNIETYRK